jgi:hypothetical protein
MYKHCQMYMSFKVSVHWQSLLEKLSVVAHCDYATPLTLEIEMILSLSLSLLCTNIGNIHEL